MNQTIRTTIRSISMLVAIALVWSLGGSWLESSASPAQIQPRASAPAFTAQSIYMAPLDAPGKATTARAAS